MIENVHLSAGACAEAPSGASSAIPINIVANTRRVAIFCILVSDWDWNDGASLSLPRRAYHPASVALSQTARAASAIAGQVAQAEAEQKAALASDEAAIQNAFADVENALAANANLREQLAAQGRLVRALSEYARLARLQFTGGYTSYTTVLQAEQQLFPAELNLAAFRAQLYGSLVNIYKALGGGWVEKADGFAQQRVAGRLPAGNSGPRAAPMR